MVSAASVGKAMAGGSEGDGSDWIPFFSSVVQLVRVPLFLSVTCFPGVGGNGTGILCISLIF